MRLTAAVLVKSFTSYRFPWKSPRARLDFPRCLSSFTWSRWATTRSLPRFHRRSAARELHVAITHVRVARGVRRARATHPVTGGVELRPAERLLVSRARDYLAAGPADVVPLIAHVCQLPHPPRSVAEHMAMALLSASVEFARETDGRWRLAGSDDALEPAPAPEPRGGWGSLDASGWAAPRAGREPCASRHGAARAGSEMLADLPYVVVDVETTGGRAFGGDRITEIAAVVVERGEITQVYETLVNPQRSIPPMITAITNITWDMVKDAPTFREIVPSVAAALRGRVFVAHNATFDWRFVSSEIGRATGERLDGRRVCTVRLARRVLPTLSRRSLDHLARYYGVEITARHRAGGDAVATAKVLVRLLRDAADRGCATWAALEALLSRPTRSRRRRRRSALPRPIDRDPLL